ncbi:prolyl-tRNA synthetase associated domain-containing protein [Clostridium sp. C105KSO13]|uniref:prolyl-tRNA synthetase associated domain-containing protein n=1 Tax=Clostridium sp. C105KSO13 TaxID=1776045 RepID=UPI0007406004|nr:prolyl-tRNA synthetase associated domain-containing protein [Clostridium sp. C105KSO13]CUX20165.1 Prolyl-tRNA editing protein ProX [Clostridium sp. C105KSO13]
MDEIHVSKEHFTSKPDCSYRTDKEAKTYDLLDKLHIPYEGVDHDVAPTIEACRAIEEELGILPCKNLFLRNRQKTTFFLLLMPGDKRFLTKDLSSQLNISRLSFAEPEFMEEFLNLTPGSVSVLGLMNDRDWDVDLLIDKELLDNEYLGCHPCMNTSTLKIKTEDILKKFLKHTGHRYTVVTL